MRMLWVRTVECLWSKGMKTPTLYVLCWHSYAHSGSLQTSTTIAKNCRSHFCNRSTAPEALCCLCHTSGVPHTTVRAQRVGQGYDGVCWDLAHHHRDSCCSYIFLCAPRRDFLALMRSLPESLPMAPAMVRDVKWAGSFDSTTVPLVRTIEVGACM